MSPPTDAEVIRASINRPEEFAEVFDRHARAVQGYVIRRAPAGTADDVLAATFLTAFEKRDRFDLTCDDARPWLLGIATNHMRTSRRSEARSWAVVNRAAGAQGVDFDDDAIEDLLDRIDAQSSHDALSSVLATLAEGDRDVLLLFAWEELSYAEIAIALDIPVGTVRSRLNRARRLLRFALRNSDEEETG